MNKVLESFFFCMKCQKQSSQVWLTLSTLQRKGLLNSSGGAVFTCYVMAKGSCVHGQEKRDLYVSFSVFFFLLSTRVGVHVHRKDS